MSSSDVQAASSKEEEALLAAAKYYENKRAKARAAYARNPQRFRTYNKMIREKNKLTKPKKEKVLSEEAQERQKAAAKARYLANKEANSLKAKAARAARKEAYAKYLELHPEEKPVKKPRVVVPAPEPESGNEESAVSSTEEVEPVPEEPEAARASSPVDETATAPPRAKRSRTLKFV